LPVASGLLRSAKIAEGEFRWLAMTMMSTGDPMPQRFPLLSSQLHETVSAA
jgi:hypothetical protein